MKQNMVPADDIINKASASAATNPMSRVADERRKRISAADDGAAQAIRDNVEELSASSIDSPRYRITRPIHVQKRQEMSQDPIRVHTRPRPIRWRTKVEESSHWSSVLSVPHTRPDQELFVLVTRQPDVTRPGRRKYRKPFNTAIAAQISDDNTFTAAAHCHRQLRKNQL